MGKNISKNISNNLNGKYSPGMLIMHQKFLDHAKKDLQQMHLKLLGKKVIQATAEPNGDLIGNKFLINLLGFLKISNKVIQKQLKISMMKK